MDPTASRQKYFLNSGIAILATAGGGVFGFALATTYFGGDLLLAPAPPRPLMEPHP